MDLVTLGITMAVMGMAIHTAEARITWPITEAGELLPITDQALEVIEVIMPAVLEIFEMHRLMA